MKGNYFVVCSAEIGIDYTSVPARIDILDVGGPLVIIKIPNRNTSSTSAKNAL